MYIGVNVSICVYMYISVYLYICISVYMYICIDVIYIYRHTFVASNVSHRATTCSLQPALFFMGF